MSKAGCLLAILFTLRIEATTRCGVRFRAPSGWTLTRVADKNIQGCRVGLKPADWDVRRRKSEFWIPDFALYVTTVAGPADFATGDSGFDRVGHLRDEGELPERFSDLADDDWLIYDKAFHQASRIHGRTWTGAIGDALVRTRGRHPASSVEYRALFIESGGHHRTAFAWCEQPSPCEALLPAFVASFRFSR